MKLFEILLGLLVLVGVVAAVVIYPVAVVHSRTTVQITVEDRERGTDSKPTLVFAEDETYKVKDSWLAGHFNSSDTYRDLRPGHTYSCKVQGWRVPFFSMYRNILECK